MTEHREQPFPRVVAGPDVWRAILDEHPEAPPSRRARWEERRQLGIQRYREPLRPFNGRDVRRDLTEELDDGLAYSRQLMFQEPSNPHWRVMHAGLLVLQDVLERGLAR
jgi:hypothetical protein